MGHNRLFQLNPEPFEGTDDHISGCCLELSEFPSTFGVDYFNDSENERSEDIQWLQDALPYANITEEDGQHILHTDKEFRKNLESEIRKNMNKASSYLNKQLSLKNVNLASVKYQSSYMMRTTDVLFHMGYIRTDIQLLEWLRFNRKVKKLYIGGIIDYHY
ncbi:MAG TPA: hypothetical protein PLZ43_13345 [bacterium]|nr:hypothetical protein [bacterium]